MRSKTIILSKILEVVVDMSVLTVKIGTCGTVMILSKMFECVVKRSLRRKMIRNRNIVSALSKNACARKVKPSFCGTKSILRRCQSIGELSGRCESKHDNEAVKLKKKCRGGRVLGGRKGGRSICIMSRRIEGSPLSMLLFSDNGPYPSHSAK